MSHHRVETHHDDGTSFRPRSTQGDPGAVASSISSWSRTAFGLLGLVLWQNREKIRAVFSHPLDLRLLALGVAHLPVQPDHHLRAVVPAGPGDRAEVHPPVDHAPGLHRLRLQPGDPRRGGGRLHQGGLPGPHAHQEDAGDRLDADRPDPRPARAVRARGRGGGRDLERGHARRSEADPGGLDRAGDGLPGPGPDLHPGAHAASSPFRRSGHGRLRRHHDRAERHVHDLSAPARRGLRRALALGRRACAQRLRVLPDGQDALSRRR